MVLALKLPAAQSGTDPERIWTALANGRPNDVLRALRGGEGSRAEKLAWAAARIGGQPATDDHMRAAESVLAELARGDDELAAQAAYLRARIYQVHLSVPDYARAAELYGELARRWPGSHWSQQGLVKLAVLKLYVLPDSAAPDSDRLAPAEALLERISEPRLKRDLHLQIGQAGVVLHQPLARFLPHLVAADRIGGVSGTAREDLIVQIGVLSERSGLWSQAKDYFERYLAEYPTNVRAFTVKQKLDEATRRVAKGSGA
ncbi:MAG: hypothetical protein JWM88_1594 [Verrucomicrobia bacterium]|nr:hypothetical protein [Verrucomicrobiota bacterium]